MDVDLGEIVTGYEGFFCNIYPYVTAAALAQDGEGLGWRAVERQGLVPFFFFLFLFGGDWPLNI